MNAKAARVMLIFAAFLGGLVLFFGAVLFVAERGALPGGPAIATVGGPFRLEDQNGTIVTDADMKGRPFLVFFGFTHCPDICPTTLFDMSQVLKALGPDADKVDALFITVDPQRDTPAVMKDYLSNFDPHLRGLTGDQASIDAAIKAYRVYAKKVPLDNGDYTMDHTAIIYLMDKNSRFVAPFSTKAAPEAEAAELRRYL